MKFSKGKVDYFAIASNDLRPTFAVSFLDRLLYMRDRFVTGKDSGNAEKACLHYGVNAAAHSDLLREGISIDDKEPNSPIDNLFLHFPGQAIPNCVCIAGGIQ